MHGKIHAIPLFTEIVTVGKLILAGWGTLYVNENSSLSYHVEEILRPHVQNPLALWAIAHIGIPIIGAVTIPQILRMTQRMIRELKRKEIIEVYGEAVDTSTYLQSKERNSGLDPDEAKELARTKAARDKLSAVLGTIDEERGWGEYVNHKRTARIEGRKRSSKRK